MGQSIIPSKDLEKDIDRYIRMGYRMDMIMPADAPREAVVSRIGESIRLVSNLHGPPEGGTQNGWIQGRAGMMYRDLIPGRAGGKIVASHIRLAEDGPVPDYVHYHKIQFQLIYCLRGRIRVIYEDQGSPCWLEAGDCVLQPPEIRHRVLESTGQAEVVEISMPAVHETWVEHEIQLPTSELKPDHDFAGQRFCRYIAAEANWQVDEGGIEYSDTQIASATGGLAKVHCVRSFSGKLVRPDRSQNRIPRFYFCFVTKGERWVNAGHGSEDETIRISESLFLPDYAGQQIVAGNNAQFFEVSIF